MGLSLSQKVRNTEETSQVKQNIWCRNVLLSPVRLSRSERGMEIWRVHTANLEELVGTLLSVP